MKTVKVGIIGLGVVGTGALKILINEKKSIHEKTNVWVEVAKACDININRDFGFDFNKYPNSPNSIDLNIIINEINLKLSIWKTKVKEQVDEHQNLNTFKIHLFILPFPSVQEFRDYFLKELGIR